MNSPVVLMETRDEARAKLVVTYLSSHSIDCRLETQPEEEIEPGEFRPLCRVEVPESRRKQAELLLSNRGLFDLPSTE